MSLQEEREESKMAANVESMFYTRTAPWHGLGVRVEEVLGSKEALIQAGLDWKVEQTDVYAASGERILGYKANIRDIDRSVLGIVGDRYKIVQNEEAFAFTDGLLGEGVKYETAGSLAGGKIVWMLAKIPEKYIISGDAIEPYLVFCNSHDGSGAIRVAMTPVRVVCQNTLNLALKGASRVWSARHTENVMSRMDEARETLQLANAYMSQLGRSINELQAKKLTDKKVLAMIDSLYPVSEDLSEMQKKNNLKQQEILKACYFDAPDLQGVGKNGYRFINAVSDMAYHGKPLRQTKNYNENLFRKTIDGLPVLDKTYQMLLSV